MQGPQNGKTRKAGGSTAQKSKLAHPSSYTVKQLESYLKGLFTIADVNGDGVLQPDELTKLLQMCGFELSAEEIAQFVSAADTNHDGVIEYDEFVPVASKMLQSQKALAQRTLQMSSLFPPSTVIAAVPLFLWSSHFSSD